ncbi:hypothetical protein V8C42DRAFT_78755 [Trichoderma barbatum]
MSFGGQSVTTSTASSIIYTPKGESIAIGDLSLLDDPSDAVPWPGNTYIIQDKDSGRAITLGGYLHLYKDSKEKGANHWLCVETRGYYGFFNKNKNSYLSFRGGRLQVAGDLGLEGLCMPRRHPKGGYQLLVPVGESVALKQVAIFGTNSELIVRQHAGAIWEFIQVPESN